MDDPRRLEAKGLARAKIRAKRRRVSSIRSRTIRGSLALFAAAWVIVFAQLVTGNDPVLGSGYPAKRKPIASRPAAEVEAPEPESESVEVEPEPVEVEPEPEPEVEFEPEPESTPPPEPEPEPEPVVTSAS
jgi:outer membrane biosynthesis protein TonB